MFFIIEEAKETTLDFSQGTVGLSANKKLSKTQNHKVGQSAKYLAPLIKLDCH